MPSIRIYHLVAGLFFLWPTVAGAASVTLAWDANPEPTITGYILSYGTTSGVHPTSVNVGNQTSYTVTGLADGQRYYFTVRAYNSLGQQSPASYEVVGPTVTLGDFEGDSKSDIGVWRPGSGLWFLAGSSIGFSPWATLPWGAGSAGDLPVPGDYDGDKRTDIAIWRPNTGTWYLLLSSTGYSQSLAFDFGFGPAGDRPVPGDYDGDGRTDAAVWRGGSGSWYVAMSSSNYTQWFEVRWGAESAGDRPVPADYDGDGRTDIAIWRQGSGLWYVLKSSRNYATPHFEVQWGLGAAGDRPVPGDYDGDGKGDIAVWREGPGTWYVLQSTLNYSTSQWLQAQWGLGAAGDVPVPADYDGDRKTDFAVFRAPSGVWYILKSSTNYTQFMDKLWGTVGDVPIVVK